MPTAELSIEGNWIPPTFWSFEPDETIPVDITEALTLGRSYNWLLERHHQFNSGCHYTGEQLEPLFYSEHLCAKDLALPRSRHRGRLSLGLDLMQTEFSAG